MSIEHCSAFPRWATTSQADWNDWKWQLRNAVRGVEELNDILASFTDHRVQPSATSDRSTHNLFAFKVTPTMISALRTAVELRVPGAWSAFCASFLPTDFETAREPPTVPLRTDSIGEDLLRSHPAAAITRFYGNRVLLRMTHMCPAYCRYCFRRRMVGDATGAWNQPDIDAALRFVRSDSSIVEVILSGGDPLLLGDERFEYVLKELADVEHITRVRIDTKGLTVLPQRITAEFAGLLRRYRLTAFVGHFVHPYELSPEVETATARLVDSGVPVYAHIPLLHGINDDEGVLFRLVDSLVDFRIKPYYLIQFIPTSWTEHFRVTISRGLELMGYLYKHCSGLAVPTYIVYLPSGHGKVPLLPQYVIRRSDSGYVFRSHDGAEVLYREPLVNGDLPPSTVAIPGEG